MRYRTLGRTGWEVSEIGFGAWGIGKHMWVGADDEESLRALHRAADQGVNFIDTALAYGDGYSEKLVGRFIKERSERIYVATKVPPKNQIWPAKGTLDEVFPPSYVIECAETSLSNLGADSIDLLQLHVWDARWFADPRWFEPLDSLRRQGKIRYFGISINDHDPDSALEIVGSGKIDTVQVIYNIFDQKPEDRLFPLCQQKNVGVIARVPFDEGALTGSISPDTVFPAGDWRNSYFRGDRKREVHDRVQKLKGLLDTEAGTLPDLALKFCLHHPAVSSVIPGMRKTSHVDSNIAVTNAPPLSARLVERLREHRWEKNFYS